MISLRTGVLSTDSTRTAHFWYRDKSGVTLRLCDADSESDAPEPRHTRGRCAICDACKFMFADDVSAGRNLFEIEA